MQIISTIDLSYVVTVKYTMEIFQNFVAFSEYMNFTGTHYTTTKTAHLHAHSSWQFQSAIHYIRGLLLELPFKILWQYPRIVN